MKRTLKNVRDYSKIGSLLKFAQAEFDARKINKNEYLQILNSCAQDTKELKKNSNHLTNQIEIPFNF